MTARQQYNIMMARREFNTINMLLNDAVYNMDALSKQEMKELEFILNLIEDVDKKLEKFDLTNNPDFRV